MSDESNDDGVFDENKDNLEDSDDSDDEDDDDDAVAAAEAAKAKAQNKKRKKSSSDVSKPAAKKSRPSTSLIDDAAEESGDEGGGNDDEDDDDDEDENDYVKDDFVVDDDEIEKRAKKKPTGELEDSDDEDDDDDNDDDDDDDDEQAKKKQRARRVRKMRQHEQLADEDLDLIREAQGVDLEAERLQREREERERNKVIVRSGQDLEKGLFHDSDAEDGAPDAPRQASQRQVERYDEDGMDDFIDDDIGDQYDILASERNKFAYGEDGETGVSESQLNEASEIFGTDYLEFMAQDEDREDDEDDELFNKRRFRESGVGVDLGIGSDEEEYISDDDDDDLFGDDDGDGVQSEQKKEALKLKREKRELARKERRQKAQAKKIAKQKADLRKQFEPVQLVENFCTDRDDQIRQKDVPERFFDWNVPFHGDPEAGTELSIEEEEEAIWIMSRIPGIQAEYSAPYKDLEELDNREKSILNSIAYALRFMHRDKLEPAFIKRYRKDVISSSAVRANLYEVFDQDAEWDELLEARAKVKDRLEAVTEKAEKIEAEFAQSSQLEKLEAELAESQSKLEETAAEEAQIKKDIEDVGTIDESMTDKDDEDELFGDDEDDAETAENKAKKEKKANLEKHLSTIQALFETLTEKVAELQTKVQSAQDSRSGEGSQNAEVAIRVQKKTCREKLWNFEDIDGYAIKSSDENQIRDVNNYLKLIEEGNEAILRKELPSYGVGDGKDDKKRSRRFDRDYYRTCVSEGHRGICYRFLLAPNRVGIKLQDTLESPEHKFDFSKKMPGESEMGGGPMAWVPPEMHQTPSEFANGLVDSGELVDLSSMGVESGDAGTNIDPLRGCRYVAALELAQEPRVRHYLRNIYKKNALLTTRPTKKGIEEIDAFHEYYGVELIHNKAVKDHFPLDMKELQEILTGKSFEERVHLEEEMKNREKTSCLQFLNIFKAEKTGHVTVSVHLPFLQEDGADWYKDNANFQDRSRQDVEALLKELRHVYLPLEVDSPEWNEEREKVLFQTIMTFLLPQFEAETRRELNEAAFRMGVSEAAGNLFEMAMEGPYRPQALMHTESRYIVPTGDLPMVGICCSSDPKEATYLASVTETGALQDHLVIPAGSRFDHPKNREKIQDFLFASRPAAVLVGTSGGMESRSVQRKMNDIVATAVSHWSSRYIQGDDEDDEEFESRKTGLEKFQSSTRFYGDEEEEDDEDWKCNADLIDDSVSQVFAHSPRGKKEFPDLPPNLRAAISIARYGKDPLAEIAYSWNVASDAGLFGTELLYINIHPMQQLLKRFKGPSLIRHYERALCEVVAEVGVDVNKSCEFDHLLGLLTFVSGFGPRKAANVKQRVAQRGSPIATRRSMLEDRFMGPVVYNNSVAFLRIGYFGDESRQSSLHPLDDTRLHPDVYAKHNFASKIAMDALERAEDSRGGRDASIKALRDVMDNSAREVERLFDAYKEEYQKQMMNCDVTLFEPRTISTHHWKDKVDELDLDAYANMIEGNGNGKWLSHLEMIKWEFRLPFADPRKPMKILEGDRLFRLLTGETDQSLRPGKEITARVQQNGEFGSKVKLEGSIPGFVLLRNLADENVESAEDAVAVGSIVNAIVLEVKKDHFSVDLSLKMEDLRKLPSSWQRPESLPQLDFFYDISASKMMEEKKEKEREARLEAMSLKISSKLDGTGDDGTKMQSGRVTRRACAHPAFRNAKGDEVDAELKNGGALMVGEALVRPSSRAADCLAIHWLYREDHVKIIEVKEEDKDTDASIGNVLKVKNESYGSIDELLGRYIAPMNDLVEELINHRKFLDLAEDEIDDKLKDQKKAAPMSIPYNLCWMELHPGYASLRFILSQTPRQHPVGITPNGFIMSTKTFKSLDLLLNYFKKNPKGVSTSKGAQSPPRPQSSAPSTTAPTGRASRWGDRASQRPPPPAAALPPLPPAYAAVYNDRRPPPPGPPAVYGQPPPPMRPPPPPGPPPPGAYPY